MEFIVSINFLSILLVLITISILLLLYFTDRYVQPIIISSEPLNIVFTEIKATEPLTINFKLIEL